MDILQNLLSKSDLLLMFLGFVCLLWKAMDALQSANSENAELTKLMAKLMAGIPPSATPEPPKAEPVPPEKPQEVLVLDQKFIDAIRKLEGYAPKAKWDYKQYTNGYGTKALSADETISEAEANRRLIAELGNSLNAVKSFVPANTPIGVEQALTSATFNMGTAWMQAGLGQAVKAGNWESAKEHLLQYNHAGGQVLDGLTKRRQEEVTWFDNPL